MNKLIVVLVLSLAAILVEGGNRRCNGNEANIAALNRGHQHADCYYVPDIDDYPTPGDAQDEIDRFWIRKAMEVGMRSPFAPFGAVIVDSRDNSLSCEGVSDRSVWYDNHGERAAIDNCTSNKFPDVGFGDPNPAWQYQVMYTDVESCPLCFGSINFRGINKMVFGARSSELRRLNCWGQFLVTDKELADQGSAGGRPSVEVRGPLSGLEAEIISHFPNFCGK